MTLPPSAEELHGRPENPFPGLRSFSDSDRDAALFFGRDRDQELIVANLLSSRLTLLYGQSGIGKSSILCAGVVNRLRRSQAGSENVSRVAVVYVSDWHADPAATILEQLRHEAQRLTGEEIEPAPKLPFDLALAWWAQRLDAPLLLILDQFEQYLLHHPPAQSESFDRALAEVVLDRRVRVRCLISLREDTLSGLDRFKAYIPNLFANRMYLAGLGEQAALEAIRRPVQRFNEWAAAEQPPMELESGLAEAIARELQEVGPDRVQGATSASTAISDDGERPIEPAHLQLVMAALWARETGSGSKLIRLATLAAMGGCEEIVRSHVEASLAELPANERLIAGRAIYYLVTPSGAKVAYTPSDLARYVDAPDARVAKMLEHLCAVRIMRPLPPLEGSQERRYEVFHDLLAEPLLEWRASERLGSRLRWVLAVLSAAVAAALAIAAYSGNPPALQHLEASSLDARFAVRGTIAPDRDIVIVYVDDQTLRALGAEGLGISLRPAFATLIDLILAGHPKVLADDIDFRKAGDEPSLLEAIKKAAGRIVLVSEEFDSRGDVPLFGREQTGGATPLLEMLNAKVGYGAFPLDAGDFYRRMQYSAPSLEGQPKSRLPTFAVAVADVAEGKKVPSFAGSTLIDYHGPPHTFPSVSMIDVLRGVVHPGFFARKIVVLGTSAPQGGDLHRTPFNTGATMPGSEIQANAISTVRHGPPFASTGAAVGSLLVLALSLTAVLAAALRGWLALAVFPAVAGAYLLLAQLLFDAGLYVPVAAPMLVLVLAAAGTLLARAYLVRQERAWRRPAGGPRAGGLARSAVG
jgi:CHASE2 domain-containing sensor protein